MKLKHEVMLPDRFRPLARFNSERTRGLIHTPEWGDQMSRLQVDFDTWLRTTEAEVSVIYPPDVL